MKKQKQSTTELLCRNQRWRWILNSAEGPIQYSLSWIKPDALPETETDHLLYRNRKAPYPLHSLLNLLQPCQLSANKMGHEAVKLFKKKKTHPSESPEI